MSDAGERRGAVDQPDMGPRLREVAHEAPRSRAVLLADETDIVAKLAQALEQGDGLLDAAHEGEVVDEPERAGQEDALAPRKAVAAVAGAVAEHEAVIAQLALDGFDGAAHALVGGR